MRVLLILPEPPAPFGGAAARWYHVLMRGLVARNAEVVALICSGGPERDNVARAAYDDRARLEFFAPARRTVWSKLSSLSRPFSYPYSRHMAATVRHYCSQEFDIIRFETHFAAWATPNPPLHAELSVLQLHAIDSSRDELPTLYEKILRSRVLSVERSLLKRFARVSVLTDRLAAAVSEMHPSAKLRVTPMTIDPDLYEFKTRDQAADTAPTFGLIGSFNWGPSLSAGKTLVEQIWPQIKTAMPAARLLLVGRGADLAFGHLKNDPAIDVHSDVPDTIPYFRQLDTMVYMPTVGSGMKVKVMEAIALGTPVLTNKEGVEGLPASIANEIAVEGSHAVVNRLLHPLQADLCAAALWERRSVMFKTLSPDACVDRVCECI